MKTLLIFGSLIGLLLTPLTAAAADEGYLGLSISADGEGFFLNPTLKTITISKVAPESPAAKAGIEPGDQIVEIEGRKVAGAKANDLKPHMEREVGQTVRLAIKKVAGGVNQVSVVFGQRPE